MIKIYDFPHGARGLRVAWLCEEMGLAHTFVPVGFPPDRSYRALNPFGTVPFLQDGHVSMSESVAMSNWSAVGIESRLKGTIDGIGDELGDREFLVGSSLTLADISVATAFRIWSRGVGQDLPATLLAYCERLQERPACKRAVGAHAQGGGQS